VQARDQDAGALYIPARSSARSPFSTTDDLQKWFWLVFPESRLDPKFHDLYSTWGGGWALHDLDISPYTTDFEGGKNSLVSIAQQSYADKAPDVDKQWYNVDGTWYRATGASYTFTVNLEGGVLIGLNRESPRYAAKDRNPPVPAEMLPRLNQFSDVAWITWKAYAGLGVKISSIFCRLVLRMWIRSGC
jgi:hypothetical protein